VPAFEQLYLGVSVAWSRQHDRTFEPKKWKIRIPEIKYVSAAKVLIMRLVQRSCTALRANSPDAAARAVTNVMTTAAMLMLI
jgi:hypothetical protein